MQVKYLELIRGLPCPYCGAGKKLSRPKVSIVIEADGRGYVVCMACLTDLKVSSGLVGEALTQWVAKAGAENETHVYNAIQKLMDKHHDPLLINAMDGFGDEHFRRCTGCEKHCTEHLTTE